jgi:hypothetical protein
MQGLDRGDLHRLSQARRKAGLDDPGVHPGGVELGDRLLHDLATVRNDQDFASSLDGLCGDGRGDDRLARAGRRDQQDAAVAAEIAAATRSMMSA